jgi:hypothetical protein
MNKSVTKYSRVINAREERDAWKASKRGKVRNPNGRREHQKYTYQQIIDILADEQDRYDR